MREGPGFLPSIVNGSTKAESRENQLTNMLRKIKLHAVSLVFLNFITLHKKYIFIFSWVRGDGVANISLQVLSSIRIGLKCQKIHSLYWWCRVYKRGEGDQILII